MLLILHTLVLEVCSGSIIMIYSKQFLLPDGIVYNPRVEFPPRSLMVITTI
jgi:hypothetical protein